MRPAIRFLCLSIPLLGLACAPPDLHRVKVPGPSGLFDGRLGFGGEESAGAAFLRRDGAAWTTDKDGIVPALLSAEITAAAG